MNAAGQASGLLTKSRPAAEILLDMAGGAADILARQLREQVTATPAS
jgi:hypothetical protein